MYICTRRNKNNKMNDVECWRNLMTQSDTQVTGPCLDEFAADTLRHIREEYDKFQGGDPVGLARANFYYDYFQTALLMIGNVTADEPYNQRERVTVRGWGSTVSMELSGTALATREVALERFEKIVHTWHREAVSRTALLPIETRLHEISTRVKAMVYGTMVDYYAESVGMYRLVQIRDITDCSDAKNSSKRCTDTSSIVGSRQAGRTCSCVCQSMLYLTMMMMLGVPIAVLNVLEHRGHVNQRVVHWGASCVDPSSMVSHQIAREPMMINGPADIRSLACRNTRALFNVYTVEVEPLYNLEWRSRKNVSPQSKFMIGVVRDEFHESLASGIRKSWPCPKNPPVFPVKIGIRPRVYAAPKKTVKQPKKGTVITTRYRDMSYRDIQSLVRALRSKTGLDIPLTQSKAALCDILDHVDNT